MKLHEANALICGWSIMVEAPFTELQLESLTHLIATKTEEADDSFRHKIGNLEMAILLRDRVITTEREKLFKAIEALEFVERSVIKPYDPKGWSDAHYHNNRKVTAALEILRAHK